jgi:hypothetical protein
MGLLQLVSKQDVGEAHLLEKQDSCNCCWLMLAMMGWPLGIVCPVPLSGICGLGWWQPVTSTSFHRSCQRPAAAVYSMHCIYRV